MITYFKYKNQESKKRNENYTTLSTKLESVDTIVNIGATSTSITLTIIGIGLNILPIRAGIACTLSLGNKILHKKIINKYNKDKNNMKKIEKFKPSVKTEKVYKIKIDKNECECLCKIFNKDVDEKK